MGAELIERQLIRNWHLFISKYQVSLRRDDTIFSSYIENQLPSL